MIPYSSSAMTAGATSLHLQTCRLLLPHPAYLSRWYSAASLARRTSSSKSRLATKRLRGDGFRHPRLVRFQINRDRHRRVAENVAEELRTIAFTFDASRQRPAYKYRLIC